MTKKELEKIKNHIDNIPTIAPIYVPELIAGLEEALSDVARYKEEAWAWCCVANERALERDAARDARARLRSALRLLLGEAQDKCVIRDTTFDAVAAALKEDSQ